MQDSKLKMLEAGQLWETKDKQKHMFVFIISKPDPITGTELWIFQDKDCVYDYGTGNCYPFRHENWNNLYMGSTFHKVFEQVK